MRRRLDFWCFATVPTKLRAETSPPPPLVIGDHDANLVRSQCPPGNCDFPERSTFRCRRNFACIRTEASFGAKKTRCQPWQGGLFHYSKSLSINLTTVAL